MQQNMTKVISVRFRDNGRAYYFDPRGITFKKGDTVIVETEKGLESGIAAAPLKEVPSDEIVKPFRALKRVATKSDLEKIEKNKEAAKKAYAICRKKIEDHGLEMFLTEAESNFEGTKFVFYYTADGRVDFRELLKDLSGALHTRIELRQIGVRDEARMMGGLGVCGRPFCCSTFLDEFCPVTIKMAKNQGLALSPSKISGTCGRLMCCLQYEENAYEYLNRITPPRGSIIDCREGRGVVVDSMVLSGMLKVQLDDMPDGAPITVSRSEVRVVKKPGKKKKESDD